MVKIDDRNPAAANKDMSANCYQQLAARTINKQLTPHEMEMHSLHGMSSEVGEIHAIYQKFYQGHETNDGTMEHLKKELGDVLWFIAEYCSAMGWDLSEVMETNIEKLKARYPEGFSTNESINRKPGDI